MLRPALVLGAAAVTGLTPQALATALLKTPIGNAELPHGFVHAQLEKRPPTANGRRYHAVGSVDAALTGPDTVDAIAWIVFPSHKDAIGDLDNPRVGNGVQVIDTVPGIRESLVLTGPSNGERTTDAAAVVGNVLVQGAVVSGSVRTSTAILLLRAAIAHLERLR